MHREKRGHTKNRIVYLYYIYIVTVIHVLKELGYTSSFTLNKIKKKPLTINKHMVYVYEKPCVCTV